jgi:phenylacetate-CoA ligase
VDSLLLQFVQGDEEVGTGETGEIICTSLFNYAMPFIRYAIGDLGVQSDEECPCGRTLPLMKMIEGRRDSLLPLPDGRVLSPRAFTVAVSMFEYYDHFDQFRIVQKKLDLFRIFIKLKEGAKNQEIIASSLNDHLRKVIGKGSDLLRFEIEFVDEIPVDKTGKLMMVASELPGKSRNLIEASNTRK